MSRRQWTRVPWLPERDAEGRTFAADDERHGTVHGYGNFRCRCTRCREAQVADCFVRRADRAERLRRDPSLAEHGNASTYFNWACRCVECRVAANKMRGGNGQLQEPAEHGTRSKYNRGCRCDDCRCAENDYQRERRRERVGLSRGQK